MRKKTIMVTGLMMFLLLTTVGCKKKDAAVQTQTAAAQKQITSAQKQTPPAREKIPKVTFSPTAPSGLPNVQAFPGGIGNVDWINDAQAEGEIKVKRKDVVSMTGWAANNNNKSIPSTVLMQLNLGNKSYYALATRTKQKRPDIAKAINNPVLADSAWQLDADISSVPPGKYLIGFILSDGTYIIGFDTTKYLVVE
jgi:hypothetical protein